MWVIPSDHITGSSRNNIKIGSMNVSGHNKGKWHIMLTGQKEKKPYPLEKYKHYENAFKKYIGKPTNKL
jgi:hypothetical protein